MSAMRLSGKTALITGAAGGLGAEIARRFRRKAPRCSYAMVYLASDEASFITGAAIPVDGGVTTD